MKSIYITKISHMDDCDAPGCWVGKFVSSFDTLPSRLDMITSCKMAQDSISEIRSLLDDNYDLVAGQYQVLLNHYGRTMSINDDGDWALAILMFS